VLTHNPVDIHTYVHKNGPITVHVRAVWVNKTVWQRLHLLLGRRFFLQDPGGRMPFLWTDRRSVKVSSSFSTQRLSASDRQTNRIATTL